MTALELVRRVAGAASFELPEVREDCRRFVDGDEIWLKADCGDLMVRSIPGAVRLRLHGKGAGSVCGGWQTDQPGVLRAYAAELLAAADVLETEQSLGQGTLL